jgi:hypothetical protein
MERAFAMSSKFQSEVPSCEPKRLATFVWWQVGVVQGPGSSGGTWEDAHFEKRGKDWG